MIFILSMNWLTSILFISMNHPLTLGGILLAQTIIMGLTTGFLYYNFWFGYIIFLVMISGLLIMFIYMTSIASNEKFKMMKINNLALLLTMSFIYLMLLFNMDSFLFNLISSLKNNLNTSLMINNMSLNKFYTYPFLWSTLSLMMYLLLTLFVIVKISTTNNGPLRQK